MQMVVFSNVCNSRVGKPGVELVAGRRDGPSSEDSSACWPTRTRVVSVPLFRCGFAWMVIEHLHDPQATLREIRRIAKESAWLVFSVPNVGCWEPLIFRRYWYSLQLPTHLHQFTPHTLRQLLHQNGFELVRVIHQRNVLSIVGSLGIWLREQFPWIRLGPKLVRFADDVSLWGRLALAPLAILLAWLHQGGRLTVVARFGLTPPSTTSSLRLQDYSCRHCRLSGLEADDCWLAPFRVSIKRGRCTWTE